MSRRKIGILDSTLRDGAQGEGISFSVSDKLNIVKALDSFGIDFIEAGNPGSNPKDMEFFQQA
ncbi:MAG: citramalate synthase, partial [Clostridia bacterium]|nr:citramalate synthase [Clostridia bacterium]